MALSWDGGMEVTSNGFGHVTKMTAMPIYGKTFKNLLLQNYKLVTLKFGMQHLVKYYQFCPNDDPG